MPEFDLLLLLYGLAVGLAAGLLGGLMAGLAGAGGGLIYVPVFYALMPGNSEGMGSYIFASLVAVIMTGFFSSRSHWRLGHVDKVSIALFLPGLIVGAGLGLWSTLHVPGMWILLALAVLNAWVAFDYSRALKLSVSANRKSSWLAAPIGYTSGLLGIGGGTMLVPLLRRSLALRHAVGTSAVCGFMMALGAVAMNILLEGSWYGVLSQQWVFLLGAWLGIVSVLPVSINFSARLHDSMAEPTLCILLKSVFITLSLGLLLAMFLS